MQCLEPVCSSVVVSLSLSPLCSQLTILLIIIVLGIIYMILAFSCGGPKLQKCFH